MTSKAQGSGSSSLLTPRPWNERDPVIGCFKGERSYLFDHLAELLEEVKPGIDRESRISWSGARLPIRAAEAVGPIINSGLIARSGSNIRLSPHGEQWLEDRSPTHLIAVLHAHVRFIGELLEELATKSMSAPKLLEIAISKYGFGWTTSGPIHNRTKWLLSAGLIDSFSHKFHLTEAGRDLVGKLQVYKPAPEILSPSDLQPAPASVNELLNRAKDDQTSRSRAASCYIPGIKGNNGQLGPIAEIVGGALEPISDDTLLHKISDAFETSNATAETATRSFRLLGLIEKVSATDSAATNAARSWLETGYDVDLARIVHASIWYFAEIVGELDQDRRLTFSDVLDRCSKYSLDGHFEPMKRGGLTARIALLEALGMITKVSNHYYRATSLGLAFKEAVPCIESTADTARPSAASEQVVIVGDTSNRTVNDVAPLPASLLACAEKIASEVSRAARLGHDPTQLEMATVSALNFLGLPARHIGGNENPDGVFRDRPGQLGSCRTVETKATSSGLVPEEQAKQATLNHHREQHNAVSTLYIGPGFERRLLDLLDGDDHVAVLSSTLLAEAVRRQVDTPLRPVELEPLFDPSMPESDRRRTLLEVWRSKEQRARCIRGIVDIAAREADAPMLDDDEPDSIGPGWLDVTSIRRSLRALLNEDMPRSTIDNALNYLSLDEVGVLEHSEGKFRLQVSFDSVPRLFPYLGRVWEVGDATYHKRRQQ